MSSYILNPLEQKWAIQQIVVNDATFCLCLEICPILQRTTAMLLIWNIALVAIIAITRLEHDYLILSLNLYFQWFDKDTRKQETAVGFQWRFS